MNISEALKWAKTLLVEKGTLDADASSSYLLSTLLEADRTHLLTHPEQKLTADTLSKYKRWVLKRSKHEPVWYITGKITFLGLDFSVNRDVLIPRPETELLVEKITEHFRDGFSPKTVLDIGTGSGAIIVSLANILDSRASKDCDAKFFTSDISEKALTVAHKNAKALNFDDRIEFRQGSLFEPWKGQRFDLIVANLPYVPETDKYTLEPDLTSFEPHSALFGGADGLEIIRDFISELPNHLNVSGKVFMEIGYEQGEKIQKIVADTLPRANVTVLTDYDNVDRIVIIEL